LKSSDSVLDAENRFTESRCCLCYCFLFYNNRL